MSILALIIGLVLLLVFMQYYAVPHMITGDYHATVCRLETAALPVLYLTDASLPSNVSKSLVTVVEGRDCVSVKVLARSIRGQWEEATLVEDSWTFYQMLVNPSQVIVYFLLKFNLLNFIFLF